MVTPTDPGPTDPSPADPGPADLRPAAPRRRRVVIVGAAGRDFHTFNMLYRANPDVEVAAFTAAQIPGIEGRCYPPELAGPLYPSGVPIEPEEKLAALIASQQIDEAVFAYSDVSHEHVMHLASIAGAAGAAFVLPSPAQTMLRSRLPVIAVTAVRTGCGKSQVSRFLAARFREAGRKLAAIRHPMPYGDLAAQAVQRFATLEDLAAARCTVEEREEYEPYIREGALVFAGADYARILEAAEREADLIVWDGGNNDTPFIRPGLHICLVDPLRLGHETRYHPGETNLRMADLVLIAKTRSARPEDVAALEENVRRINPRAAIVRGASAITLDRPDLVTGKRVLAIDDGPTITHGGMSFGAACLAADEAGAAERIDPRPFAQGSIKDVFARHPHIGRVLPAMGYSAPQLEDLEATIAASGAEAVVSGTPCDLAALIKIDQPLARARYDYADADGPNLWQSVVGWLEE